MRDHAADDDAGGQTHVACPSHGAAEQIQHADGHSAAERHVRVGERGRQHFAMPAHPSEDEGCAQQQHCRECCRKGEGQNKGVKGKRVGDIALAGTKRAGDCGRHAATHAARCRVLNQHHKWEGERHTRERIRTQAADKQSVERNHAGNRQQVQNVRCCEPQ
jgi:hypothetical protein